MKTNALDTLTAKEVRTYEELIEFMTSVWSLRACPATPFSEKAIANLCHTIASAAVDSNGIMEWNPISQRPVVGLAPPSASEQEELGSEFAKIQSLIYRYVTLCHEMLHVLVWEPLFTGAMPSPNVDTFVEMSLMGEGFCFFYSDIVLTPEIRRSFPDGEVLFTRSAASQRNFHPYRAFESIGVSDPDRILEIYLEEFSGKATELSGARGNFPSALAGRIASFYGVADVTTRRLYDVLRKFGIFDDYYARFCAPSGLPSLFNPELGALASAPRPTEYFRQLFGRGLRELAETSPEKLLRVRARRAIQTRAYFAYQLRTAIENEWYVGKIPAERRRKSIVSNVDCYIGRLESALDRLRDGGTPKQVAARMGEADRAYTEEVRRPLEKSRLWAAERQLIIPPRVPTGIGICEARRGTVTAGTAKAVLRTLIADLGKLNAAAASEESVRAIGTLATLFEDLPADDRKLLTARHFSRYVEALTAPSTIGLWSVALSDLDPAANRFREILFVYA